MRVLFPSLSITRSKSSIISHIILPLRFSVPDPHNGCCALKSPVIISELLLIKIFFIVFVGMVISGGT